MITYSEVAMRIIRNPARAGLNLLEITIASAIFFSVAAVAMTSVSTGTNMVTSVKAGSAAVESTHRVAQTVANDLRYADFNKVYLNNSTANWRSSNSAARYYSFKRCTGFASFGSGSATLASMDRIVEYTEGVVLTFARDSLDNRLATLTATTYELDSDGNLGGILRQPETLATKIAWAYFPTPAATVPVDGFDIIDTSGGSVGTTGTTTAAQGSQLRLRVASVTDTEAVRGTSGAYEAAAIRVTETTIFLRGTMFDRFALESPVINSPVTATGSVGKSFIYDITATNDPTSFTVTSLPSGLTLKSATGRISGTPTSVFNDKVTIACGNGIGTDSELLTLIITAKAPEITSPLMAYLNISDALNYQITVDIPSSGLTYSAIPLPAGLTLDSASGTIAGRCSLIGIYNITLSVTNADKVTGSKVLRLEVIAGQPQVPVINSPLSHSGNVGVALTYDITSNPAATSYEAVGLPAGLTCSTTGLITGTPTAVFNGSVTLKAWNFRIENGMQIRQDAVPVVLSLVVTQAPIPSITAPSTTMFAEEGSAFTAFNIVATNTESAYSPIIYSLVNAPSWMSINQDTGKVTCVYSEIPNDDDHTFTVIAKNKNDEGRRDIRLIVSAQAPPVIDDKTFNGTVSVPVSIPIVATSGVIRSYSIGTSPTWLSLAGSTIIGTPTAAGIMSVTVRAENFGGYDTAIYTMDIGPNTNAPTVTLPATLSTNTVTVNGVVYYEISGSLSTPGQAKLNTATFTANVTSVGTALGVVNAVVIKGWNNDGTNANSETFKIRVPKATTGGFVVKVTIKDANGTSGGNIKSY